MLSGCHWIIFVCMWVRMLIDAVDLENKKDFSTSEKSIQGTSDFLVYDSINFLVS